MNLSAEQYLNQQRQRQREPAGTDAAASVKAAGGLLKAIQQAKGRLRAPAVVAEALRALRRPQREGIGHGVLLLDMLDSVELVSNCSSSKRWRSKSCSGGPVGMRVHARQNMVGAPP